MKQKKKLIFFKSIKCKLIVYNLCISSAVAIFVSVFNYVGNNKNMLNVTKTSMENHVDSISHHFDVAYSEMINIVLNCTERGSLTISNMKHEETSYSKKQALFNKQLIDNYISITESGKYIGKLIIASRHGVYVQSGYMNGTINDSIVIESAPWYVAETNKSIEQYPLDLVDAPFAFYEKEKILPIIRYISPNVYKEAGGYVFMGVSSKLYDSALKHTNNGKMVEVITYNGDLVSSINNIFEDDEHRDIVQDILESDEMRTTIRKKIDNEDYLISFEKSSSSGLLVYEILALRDLNGEKTILIQTIFILIASSLLIGFILSVLLTNRINRPINKLVKHIKEIGNGNFYRNCDIESDDEIGMIGIGINRMSEKMEQLMKQRVDNEKEKKDLEIKMLQAQINPHFLYNTLDSIKWIAMIQKNSGIVKVVTALSCLLKNMAKGFNEKVTVDQELKFLEDYITVEKIRYVELFDVVFDIDERLHNVHIVKLTLQPLVENAIFKGIEASGRAGIINIKAYTDDINLFITVEDNGIGISKEKINNMLSQTEKVKSSAMNGIGLPNVDRRLKMVYGEEYGLTIDSVEGEYTKITVKVPLEFNENGLLKRPDRS